MDWDSLVIMITKTQQTNINVGQGVHEREKVHLVTKTYDVLIK